MLESTRTSERTPEFYSMNYAQKVNYLLKSKKTIDDKTLAFEIDKYGRELETQKNKEFESRVNAIVEQKRLCDYAEKVYKNGR